MKYDAICQKDHLLVVFFMTKQILDLKFIFILQTPRIKKHSTVALYYIHSSVTKIASK